MTDGPIVLGGRYELEAIIGRGGMAEVWRARDLRLDRLVAIKRLRVDLATDSTFQARFQREAQSAAGLNHPNIVSVYDTGEKVDPASGISVPYIVMELVEGHTLREILRQGRALEPAKAFEYTIGVLEALSSSHKHYIVHRDIKPANVMITPAGAVKVMDFGIARAVSDTSATMTQTAAVIGTAQYLSPEQARGEPVDARSDIYSAGCLLYELLTGRPPFLGDSPVSVAYQHVREMPIPPSQLDADITPEMDAITMKALAKSPDDRYQSAKAMRDDCWRLLNDQPVTAHLPAVVPVDDATPASSAGPTRALPVQEELDQAAAEDTFYTEEEEPPHKRGVSPATVMLIGLLVLLIGALGLFTWRLVGNPSNNEVAVPAVIGFQEEAAVELITGAQLTPKVEQVAGPAEGKGTVIRQNPEGNASVLVGSTVTLTVNAGPPVSQIPAGLVGMLQSEAVALLREAGFTKIDPLPAPAGLDSLDAREGEVVRVDPAEGTQVATNEQVTLYVASGMTRMPGDLVGQDGTTARSTLTAAGFTDVTIQTANVGEEPASAREGQVIRTSPTAGEQVTRSTPIVLYVAQGRAVVPDLASEHVSLAQAQERLVAAGFTSTPRVEQRDVDDTALVGRVVEQSPSAGETHDKTVPIVLWVGTLQHSASPSASTPATSSSAPPTSEGG